MFLLKDTVIRATCLIDKESMFSVFFTYVSQLYKVAFALFGMVASKLALMFA
jgi:hypothetical protein